MSDFNTWNVSLFGKIIDTVFFTTDCDAEYVKNALVDHYGFASNITVTRCE